MIARKLYEDAEPTPEEQVKAGDKIEIAVNVNNLAVCDDTGVVLRRNKVGISVRMDKNGKTVFLFLPKRKSKYTERIEYIVTEIS